jgi:hypothetical protein
MLIEVIFRGQFSTLDFSFLKKLIDGAKEIYFVSPEIPSIEAFDEVLDVLNSNAYVDLVVNTDCLKIYGKIVSRVFINLGRNDEDIEVLFYFDLKDLNEDTPKSSIDYLKKWVMNIQNEYNFQYFICQMDNASINEYYFDSNGIGELYNEISS